MQFTLNPLHLCLTKPLRNNKSTYSLCFMFLTTFSLTSFAFLIPSLSTITKEYIFDFNATNPLIIFPLTLSFILPITFLSTGTTFLLVTGYWLLFTGYSLLFTGYSLLFTRYSLLFTRYLLPLESRFTIS